MNEPPPPPPEVIEALLEAIGEKDRLKQWEGARKVALWISKTLSETLEAQLKIAQHLKILFGDDIFGAVPESTSDLLERIGLKDAQITDVSPVEFFKRLANTDLGEHWGKVTETALGMIFEQRYEWKPDDVTKLTPQEMLLALENAIDYTPPNRPDIWKMTQ
jgi:hypothetical protein